VSSTDGDVCICPGNVPVCPGCGHRWTHFVQYDNGLRVYIDARTVQRYLALYGDPTVPFQEVA
jgi:hypothetical protein